MSNEDFDKWVIQRSSINYGIGHGVDVAYFNGETYRYLGERYGVFLPWRDRNEAKLYSSKSKAESAAKLYSKNLHNSYKLEAVKRESIEKD